MEYQLFIQVYFVIIHIYGFHKPVNSISVPVLSHLRSWHLSLENMYIYMSNSKLKLTCHKLSPMAAHWWQGQSFFFLLAELPLSLASVNRCENRIAFTLDILIPRCAFLMFPSLCVLRLFIVFASPSSSCCCSVSDHTSTAIVTMFIYRLFIWYRCLFPLPNVSSA